MSSSMYASTASVPDVPVPDGLISFRAPLRSFALLNSAAKEVVAQACSNVFTLPPVNVVGWRPEVDADGDAIPGSIVITDIYDFDPGTGDEVLVLNSARVVSLILGLVPGPNGFATLANSPYAKNGISLIPRRPTKEVWHGYAETGEKRAFLARVSRARETQRAFSETNSLRKAQGASPLPMDQTEMEAMMLLREHDKLLRAQMAQTMAPHRAAAEDAEIEDELEMETFLKVQAMELANKYAQSASTDRAKLAEELLDDPKVRIALQKRYKIRKKGNLPKTTEQLQEAAAAGLEADADSGEGADPNDD